MGSGIVQFSIIWWLALNHESASVLAVAMIMGVLPVILFSPIAGVVADKYSRKTVMIAADGFIALVTLVFFLFIPAEGAQADTIGKVPIYILLFLRAVGSAFHQPAFESAIPMIVPEDHLVRTASVNQMLRSGISLLAPMLGALLVAVINLKFILLIDVATAGLAILSLALIQLPGLVRSVETPSTLSGYLSDLKLGFKYVYRWKGLQALIIMFALANFLLAPMLAMIPKVIIQHFKGSSQEYGFFEMALAVGIMLGSLSLSVWGGTKRKIIIVNIAQVLCGVFIALIAAVPPDMFGLVLMAAVLVGVSSAYVNSPVIAILQSCVDKDMLGRVMSVGSMTCSLAMPLSLVITGPLANAMMNTSSGLLPIIWVPGLLSTLLGAVCFLIPDLMHIEDRSPAKNR
jgi:MFS transporter, DHA3 family, macrolide efflux protein